MSKNQQVITVDQWICELLCCVPTVGYCLTMTDITAGNTHTADDHQLYLAVVMAT